LEAAQAAAKTTESQRQSLQILESEQELLKTSIGKNSELVSLTMDMQSRWLDQQHEQQVALNKSTISTAEQVAQERAGWLDQLRTWFQSTQSQQNHLQDLNDRIEKVIAILFEQSRQNTEFQEHMLTDQARMIEQGSAVNQLLQLMGQRAKDEQVSRTEMAHQLKMVFTDQQERHEQLISTLVNTLTAGVSGNKLNHSESAIAGTTEMSAAAVPPDKRPPANP
jgi:mRNA-degrading endonuclease YafQ of YafQ-DinJ toxin-antitoxin module